MAPAPSGHLPMSDPQKTKKRQIIQRAIFKYGNFEDTDTDKNYILTILYLCKHRRPVFALKV